MPSACWVLCPPKERENKTKQKQGLEYLLTKDKSTEIFDFETWPDCLRRDHFDSNQQAGHKSIWVQRLLRTSLVRNNHMEHMNWQDHAFASVGAPKNVVVGFKWCHLKHTRRQEGKQRPGRKATQWKVPCAPRSPPTGLSQHSHWWRISDQSHYCFWIDDVTPGVACYILLASLWVLSFQNWDSP